jgi:hypothetical protein
VFCYLFSKKMIWYVISSSLHEKHFDPQAIQTSRVVEFRSPNANLLTRFIEIKQCILFKFTENFKYKNFSRSFQPFVLIRKKLVIFVHFKGFNISHKPKSSPLLYIAQKTNFNLALNWCPIIFTCPVRTDSCSFISNIDIFVH